MNIDDLSQASEWAHDLLHPSQWTREFSSELTELNGIANVKNLGLVTGDGSPGMTRSNYWVGGTDLGIPVLHNNELYYYFGDSYGGNDDGRPMEEDWRNNVIGISSNFDFTNGLNFDRFIIEPLEHPIQVLSIGNSFSQDAQKWLHEISLTHGVPIDAYNLYIGGSGLSLHAQNYRHDNASYELEKNGEMIQANVSISEVLASQEFDIVTLQQVSSFSGHENTYEPHLTELLKAVRELQADAEIYLHQTWAYDSDSTHPSFSRYGLEQEVMHAAIVEANAKLAEKHDLKIIAVGEVINDLRNSDYFSHGSEESTADAPTLTRDGFHLDYFYGRYAAAATWFRTFTGIDVSGNICQAEIEFGQELPAENWNYIRKIVDEVAIPEPAVTYYAKELLPGLKVDGVEHTIIPTGGISIDGRLYMYFMSISEWGLPGEWTINYGGLAVSEDDGQNFSKLNDIKLDKERFGQIAPILIDDYVYFVATGHGRIGSMYAGRVLASEIENMSAYEYFTHAGAGLENFSTEVEDATPVVDAPVGEPSIFYNEYLDQFILTYFDTISSTVVMRVANQVTGPYTEALEIVNSSEYPGLYGGFSHELMSAENGKKIYLMLSHWDPIYNVSLLEVELSKGLDMQVPAEDHEVLGQS